MPKKKKNNWNVLDEGYFDETEDSVKAARVLENKDSKEKIIGFSKNFKKSNGSGELVPFKGFGMRLSGVSKLIGILTNFAHKFKWVIEGEKDLNKQISSLQEKLNDMVNHATKLEIEKGKIEEEKKLMQTKIEEVRKSIIKSNLPKFKKDVKDFAEVLDKSAKNVVPEADIQKFLKDRKWFFGVEFLKSEPKKTAGSKSEFDFYLESYKKSGVIVELKLPTDEIFKEEYEISAKVGEALGQLIRYMETTIAYSYNTVLQEIEGLRENKPLGFLVIGRIKNDKERQKLKVINSYLHGIEILSYDDLLAKSKATIGSLEVS